MKRTLNTLLISAASMLLFSCNVQESFEMPKNEAIVLDLSSGVTKAVVKPTQNESFVNHLDVFIFADAAGSPSSVEFYGRYNVNNNSQITLATKRSDYTAGQPYHLYVVANSNKEESEFSSVKEYAELVLKKQEDELLHLSGLTNVEGAPAYFLMDAALNGVVLNNGNIVENTVLSPELRRAAAKVVVKINAAENVVFKSFSAAEGSEGARYYIRNLPFDAFLLAEAKQDDDVVALVRNTAKEGDMHLNWNPTEDSKSASLLTYLYPNSWKEGIMEHETCVVINLPMVYTSQDGPIDYPNSWYKIHVTGEKVIRRNNYYEVNITINRPGATSETVPVTLEDLQFIVEPWGSQSVDVGGDDKPKYLMVNESSMEMHNIAVDAKTLEFASSSPVTITVEDAHYYDKFGQKQSVAASVVINGTTEGGIAGNITVNSPVPTNNAIRYFTLVVTNEDNIVERVQVTQYPLEYITNIQGWYSYRDDFGGTNYQNMGTNRYVAANWNNGAWSLSSSQSDNNFFGSKVAQQYQNGTSEIYRYYYSYNSYYREYVLTQNVSSGIRDLDNARMYHVQIKSTSNKYTLGVPKRDVVTDYTLTDENNSQLVSPSFMIASQLGATTSVSSTGQTYVTRAQSHCSQYVETYFEDTNSNRQWDEGETVHHLTDWRLPTQAEIAIIVAFQTSSEVMDTVLAGANYFCASPQGYVATGVSTGNSIYTRCIRDVY